MAEREKENRAHEMQRRVTFMVMAITVTIVFLGIAGGRAGAQTLTAPVANAGGPYIGVVAVPIQFDGSASTGVGLTFEWDFGDGTAGLGSTIQHTYTVPGAYSVTLTVRDAFGQNAGAVTTVLVRANTVVTSCVPTQLGLVCSEGDGTATSCALTAAGVVCGVSSIVTGGTSVDTCFWTDMGAYVCTAAASSVPLLPMAPLPACSLPYVYPGCYLVESP